MRGIAQARPGESIPKRSRALSQLLRSPVRTSSPIRRDCRPLTRAGPCPERVHPVKHARLDLSVLSLGEKAASRIVFSESLMDTRLTKDRVRIQVSQVRFQT